jgi:hypothetical protein
VWGVVLLVLVLGFYWLFLHRRRARLAPTPGTLHPPTATLALPPIAGEIGSRAAPTGARPDVWVPGASAPAMEEFLGLLIGRLRDDTREGPQTPLRRTLTPG